MSRDITSTERDELERQKQQLLQRQQELKRQLEIVNGNLAHNRFKRKGDSKEQITKLPEINRQQNGTTTNT